MGDILKFDAGLSDKKEKVLSAINEHGHEILHLRAARLSLEGRLNREKIKEEIKFHENMILLYEQLLHRLDA